MSEKNDSLDPDKNDLIPEEYRLELLRKREIRSRIAQRLGIRDSSLIPDDLIRADYVKIKAAPQALTANEIDSALGRITISKSIDLGSGLRLEPFVGRPRAGALVTKGGEGVGNLSALSYDDLGKLLEFITHPEKYNDLIPSDDDLLY